MSRRLAYRHVAAAIEAAGLTLSAGSGDLYLSASSPAGLYVQGARHPRGGWVLENARERRQATLSAWVRTPEQLSDFLHRLRAAAMPDPYVPRYLCLEATLDGLQAQTGTPATHTSIPDGRLTPYLGELREGGIVIDRRAALWHDVRLAFRSPLLDASLRAGTVARPRPSELYPGGTAAVWDRGAPEVLEPSPEGYDGLDRVALDLYTRFWQGAGARVGRRRGDAILWDDGTTTAIPLPEHRQRHPDGRPRTQHDEWDPSTGTLRLALAA